MCDAVARVILLTEGTRVTQTRFKDAVVYLIGCRDGLNQLWSKQFHKIMSVPSVI